ncbi:hypothetical protein [Lacinutrix sp. Bg11-31]|uniref:hypothetical protein n=1 Tax=Lacinutrix sp. Bg11-31 TaxID=2057808 RepID=UPI000C304909|nr:hypothetical protein [Lacinutrix sp. Bg11-31]AUC83713.1 hypothetical protein CW733_10460 [Lacinutrix sp. Bg11-31]
MTFTLKPLFILSLLFFSCNTGNLEVLAGIDNSLEEVSAIATIENSSLYWVIEDAGNTNNLYALNSKGNIAKIITITNAKNKDWEDLATDNEGNIYVGDFGNNNHKRKKFTIYKVSNIENTKKEAEAEIINFTLPENTKSEDFESFFLWNNYFYVFSKNQKHTNVFKIENKTGTQIAELVTTYKFKEKNNKITSADISEDGKTIVLLNHEKVWQLSNFDNEYFFGGEINSLSFKHDSQKEGVSFLNNKTIIITDETNKHDGNIYSYTLD